MFGNKKKKERILTDGISAEAVVINVADTGVTINDNPRVKLTLQVQPEGDAPFQAEKKVTVSRVEIPRPGDTYFVRYDPADPSEVEFDTAKVAAANAVAQEEVAQAAAATVPADLMANGILGRGACVDVQKNDIGQLVDVQMTVGVRLVDGTPPYRTTGRVSLTHENAAMITPGQTLFTVRADPNDHNRIAISLQEQTPTVTVDDPSVVDPPARALRDGVACQIQLLQFAQQFLRIPDGEELYAAKIAVVGEGEPFQIFLPVPAAGAALLSVGAILPGKRLPAEPNVATVDWTAALAGAGAGAGAGAAIA
jgi:hypothetical protein